MSTFDPCLEREQLAVAVFWCEAVAYPADHGRAFRLGGYAARTPELALGWLLERASDVADQVAEMAALPVHCWLYDAPGHASVLRSLAAGEMFVFTVFDEGVRFILSARPPVFQSPSRALQLDTAGGQVQFPEHPNPDRLLSGGP
ncbi:hypothetical protein [Streptacidiphilus sp. EB103A]|uniref:hypothetical protein n=1 Tax=Streptacidiphilus sp. EB103A TaxID=3156275 RepID=UPI00351213B7